MREVISSKFVRYVFSGGTAAFVNLLTVWFLERLGWNYLLVVTLAFIMALFVSFTLQKFLTFSDKKISEAHKQFLTFALIGVANLLINDLLVYIQINVFRLRSLIVVEAFASILIAIYSYFIYKLYVFKDKSSTANEIKVLYLFTRTRGQEALRIKNGEDHDGHFYGMFRLEKFGVRGEFLEIEQFFSPSISRFLRYHVLTMHYLHLPLFFKFFKYDVIFTSTAFGSMLLWAFWPFKKPAWIVYDYNIPGMIGDRKTWKQRVFSFMISRASGVITLSREEEAVMRNKFPRLGDLVQYVPLGIDTKFFSPKTDIEEQNVVMSVGLDPGRDFRLLLSIAKRLSAEVRVVSRLDKLVKFGPLPDNVSVLSHLPIKELLEQYAKAKILVIVLGIYPLNYNDAMGYTSLLEAMAMGKAVIATRSATMESCIENGKNGILVPTGDGEALRRAVADLLNDSGKRKKMGLLARKFVEEKREADMIAGEMASYFKRVLHARKR